MSLIHIYLTYSREHDNPTSIPTTDQTKKTKKNKKQQQQIIKGSRENYIKNIICYFSYKMVRYYLRIKWLDILVGRSLHQCIERKVHDHISRLIYYHMTFSKN